MRIVHTFIALGLLSTTAACLFQKDPEVAAYEKRFAENEYPCITEGKAAESRIAEMVAKNAPNPEIDLTWKCNIGSETEYWDFAPKNGAEVVVDVTPRKGRSQWHGASEGDEIVLIREENLSVESGPSKPAKHLVTLKRSGQTLDGEMKMSRGYWGRTGIYNTSWVCDTVKVSCTR